MFRLATFLLLVALGHVSCSDYDDGFRKFEYKHSFKPPTVADKKGRIPCWTYDESAMASSDQLRLTPSIRSRKGMAWNKFLFEKDWWEVEMVFRVTGRGRVGADGLAMWFTEQKGTSGPVFGSSDQWHGLGVFFDSFDNDGAQNNPYILMVQNDGTRIYDHVTDGSSQSMGGCMRDFRNRPHPPRALLTYYQSELTLRIDMGSSAQPNYEICARAQGIKLPPAGYFGLSAATGGLADDHDVISFKVSSITGPPSDTEPEAAKPFNPEDFQQYEDEYMKRSEELNKQKDTFYKEHPDKKPDDLADWDTEYEDPTDRRLRLILEGQDAVKDQIRALMTHISTTSLQAAGGQAQQTGQQQQQQQQQGQLSAASVALLNDLQSKLNQISQEQIVSAQMLKEIRTKTDGAAATGGAQQHPGAMPIAGTDIKNLQNEVTGLKASVENVMRLMESVKTATAQGNTGSDASQTSCVSTVTFMAASVVQLVLVTAVVVMYGRQRAAHDKKFF
ncbi:protein ERGIC-53-like [Sycon ciliatum]|uniref:protein ERGIC-53-like n=1 Tax=Sycon ciliatum TaxID=27933 RepID=UPI0020A8D59A|eukprot:scpid64497/ scgid33639/ Protein ERGIC-53; ER-Golgi intermediate compartment 53 kDa protein; Lectin mannose-binding 1; p58